MSYPGIPIVAPPADDGRARHQEARDAAFEAPKLVAGRPREQWSEAEHRDAWLWGLGPRWRAGLKPPPEPQYSIPPIPGSACDPGRSHMGSAAGL